MENPTKKQEQKPAGWNESDDLMLQSVYETLYDHQSGIRTGAMGKIDRDYVAAIDKEIAWLKSIKDRLLGD